MRIGMERTRIDSTGRKLILGGGRSISSGLIGIQTPALVHSIIDAL